MYPCLYYFDSASCRTGHQPANLINMHCVYACANSSGIKALRHNVFLICNSISLETNSNESWRKIKNFLKPKGQRDYPTLQHANKIAKTNADKAQLFAESVERHFGIESDHFDSNNFNEVNKFIEDNYQYFYSPEDPETTSLTWEMSTSLWPMLMPKYSLS